jgi:sulfite reductase beta subunit-like hemoprotein
MVADHLERVLHSPDGHADEKRLRLRPITLNWSGCPAACGNHQAADLGFLGGKTRVDGQVIEVFDIFVGGRTGMSPVAAEKVLEKIPTAELPEVAEALMRAHARGESLVEAAATIASDRATRQIRAKEAVA